MADIKIIVDTAADIPEELLKEHDIGILRFLSVFGETSYVTGEELFYGFRLDKILYRRYYHSRT